MNNKTKMMVITAIFCAIIIAMTVIPFTGYISYNGVLEITTLHIPVILSAVFLGAKRGAIVGGAWGVTCILRALTNPLWAPFINPLVSLVPRIIVGLVAGLVFAGLCKIKCNKYVSAVITSIIATITNTVTVLFAFNYFGGMIKDFSGIFETIKGIYFTIISVNGTVELVAAAIIVPVIYKALEKQAHNFTK